MSAGTGSGNRVIAVNELAADAGVLVGMRRREAEAVCPTVQSFIADPGAEAVTFDPVVTTLEEVIPRVEVVRPGLLLAPLTGAVRYYGDETAVIEQVISRLARHEPVAVRNGVRRGDRDAAVRNAVGPEYRIGLAAGPFAAQRAAEQGTARDPVVHVEDDAEFLRTLDITALGKEDLAATFRWLGITTLGELAGLPREAMVSRFGPDGLAAHRIARGDDRETRPRALPEELAVEERFDPPLENLEQAAFVARAMASRLIGAPALRGASPYRVIVDAEAADGTLRSRVWRHTDPFDEATLAERVRWQLHAWIDGTQLSRGSRRTGSADHRFEEPGSGATGIGGGLVRLRIAPDDITDTGRQLALHEDARSAAEARRTLIQTQALVGPDHVLQARPQGGRDPAERVAWHRWGEEPSSPERDPDAPWPGAVPAPTPTLTPPDPPVLEIEWDEGMPVRVRLGSRWVPVLSWAGPWRLTGRWWEGETPADRYQIVTSAGAFLCEHRNGRTYMAGVYD